MAKKKKTVKKKTTKKKATKKHYGRPPGATAHIPRGLEVRKADKLARANGLEKPKGYRRVILETHDPEHALRLEKLVKLVRKKDAKLFKMLAA